MAFPSSAPAPTVRTTSPAPTPTTFADAALAVRPTPTVSDWQDARAREVEQARIKANAMRPEYAQITDAIATRDRVSAQAPAVPQFTQPPSRGLRDFLATDPNESPVASIAKLLQAMSLFTNVAVGGSRHNAIGALAAFSGAMKGWQEGDMARADRAFSDWQAKTSTALKEYDLQRTAYNDLLTAANTSLEGRIRAAQTKALAFGDTAAYLAMESKNVEDFIKFQAGRDDAATKLENERLKAEAAWLKAQQERLPGTASERFARAQRIAQESPNDPAAQAAFKEAQAAMTQEEKLAGIRASAAAAGAYGVELNKLLTPKEAEGLIHPRTMSGPPPGTTKGQAIQQGYVETDEKDRAVIADLQQTKAIVGTLTAMTDKLITATTPSEAAVQKVRLETGAATGSNELARTYQRTVASFLGTVSKALAGERGVLTNQDLDRIRSAFPSFFDTRPVAVAKVGLLNLLIATAEQARIAKMTKQPMDDSALRGQITSLLDALERAGSSGPVSGTAAPSGRATPRPGEPGSPWRPVKD